MGMEKICITFDSSFYNMEQDPENRLEELALQKIEGKSYSEIREELKVAGMEPGEIGVLLRKVDEKVLEEALRSGRPNKSLQLHRTGLVLAVSGLLITIAFNVGVILQNLPDLAVYSPFLTGILLMFYSKMMRLRQMVREVKGPGAIRKKRPYK